MGNHRFRLSDMMPNAWFYKLKDMGRIRNQNSNQARRKKHPPTTSSSSSTTTISTSSSSSSSLSTANNAIRQQPHQPADLLSQQRKSYYFTRDLTPPPLPHSPPTYPTESNTNNNNNHPDHLPRKSQKQSDQSRSSRRNRASSKTHSKLATSSSSSSSSSSVSAGCGCRPTAYSAWTKPDSTSEEYPNSPPGSSSDLQSLVPEFGSDRHSDSSNGTVQCSGSCHCRVEKDIVINVNDQSFELKFDGFNTIPELELPPIITQKPSTRTDAIQEIKKKKKKKNDCNDPTKHRAISAASEDRNASGSLSVKVGKEEQRTSPVRRLSVSSPGLRLRTNSPRIASKRIQAHARKSFSSVSSSTTSRRSLSESFAVMKSSADPQRDFRESMVEMILENNIRASKDLEDLLACYLQLNSDEYHQLIIKVFKQIWFDLAGVKLK